MRKRTIAVGIAALIVLTGCSPTDGQDLAETTSSAAETTKAGEGPRGFHFESGFLEFGDFDPDTLGDDIFNPCTEITPEEYAAAGFDAISHDPEEDATVGRGLSYCVIEETREDGVATSFSNNRADRELISQSFEILPAYTSEAVPEMFVFRPKHGGEGLCFTQIDTVRGGFGTQAGGSPQRVVNSEICEMAIENLERLFTTFGQAPDVH